MLCVESVMASFSFDDLLDGDEATGVPDKRTWYKIGAANDSLHSEPGNSLVDWTIKLGTNQYRVHRADLGDGSNGSGYFNSKFQRWTEGSTETDLTSSLQLAADISGSFISGFTFGHTIEERFVGIETSVKFLEKEIDGIDLPDVTEIKTDIATIKADLESLERDLNKLENKDDNPLNG